MSSSDRLKQISAHLAVLPLRRELPAIDGAPPGAAWIWGKDDELGRLNLLTPQRVLAASKEIISGELIPLNLPLDVPRNPGFDRDVFEHTIFTKREGLSYDDLYKLNTQSGTQWDGFRHFAHSKTKLFYNGVTADDITSRKGCGISAWAKHGIAGRGVLLDFWGYAPSYDPYAHHEISYTDLVACGKSQGIDIRPAALGGDIQPGDILLVRSGFVDKYNKSGGTAISTAVTAKGKTVYGRNWSGLKQEESMLDWLHDCYFAAVAGDAPSFEAWPSSHGYYLHEYLLALWGCPIGEMWDLERLAERCREIGRWSFFLTSSPANVSGGVASHANAVAIL